MAQKQSLWLVVAFLHVSPVVAQGGLVQGAQAAETEAPAALPPWLLDDPADPAMADDGSVKDGDMRVRSTGLCRAEHDPSSNKRIYVCEYRVSDACVEAGGLKIAHTSQTGGKTHLYYCPAPNP